LALRADLPALLEAKDSNLVWAAQASQQVDAQMRPASQALPQVQKPEHVYGVRVQARMQAASPRQQPEQEFVAAPGELVDAPAAWQRRELEWEREQSLRAQQAEQPPALKPLLAEELPQRALLRRPAVRAR
jgi:hypothetical protein